MSRPYQLFLVRGKLGDSLVFFSALQGYLERHPQTAAVLAIRADYAPLVAGTSRAAILAFRNRLDLVLKLLWRRLCGMRFDVCAVLWGFGGIVETVARLSGAHRRIYFDGRRPRDFPEWPPAAVDIQIVDPAWRVLRLLDPTLPRPSRLDLPALAARRQPSGLVVVVPVADEARKCLDAASTLQWLARIRTRHPHARIRVLVNPHDRGAPMLAGCTWPAGVELETFSTLGEVVKLYAGCEAWYGVDTGLYHLAVGMGIPAEVAFGPTRPLKIVMPEQSEAHWLRLEALGDRDCEEKSCLVPYCIHRAIAELADSRPASEIEATPASCPLRSLPAADLDRLTFHEATHRQT